MTRRLLALLLGVSACACRTPDPQALLEVKDVETYWTVDPARGNTVYLAPAVRFTVRNKTGAPTRSIQATATFRRKSEMNATWGSDWRQVTPAGNPLQPGQSLDVLLKSDARYSLMDAQPEAFFQNPAFVDVAVEFFLRVGSSGWVKFGATDVPRQLGTRAIERFKDPTASPLPTPPPNLASAPPR